MADKSGKQLATRSFLVVFFATAIVFSVIAVAIKHEDLPYLSAFAIGIGVAFIVAVGWLIIVRLMQGVTRPGKDE